MIYKAKSAIIGRSGPRDEDGKSPVFVRLFPVNDPHKTLEPPLKFLEFEKIQKILIKGLDIGYLLGGADIFINDLEEIEVDVQKGKPENLVVTGKQKK